MKLNFEFDGNMSREVLESYLSRAVTASNLYDTDTLEDDLRAIARLGVKFIGRASGIWYMIEDDDIHFAKSKALADVVHAQDPEIILQACVFEIVTQRMDTVKIPAYVFSHASECTCPIISACSITAFSILINMFSLSKYA